MCAGKALTENDYREVYEALFDAKTKWREIGSGLGLGKPTLDNIEDQYHHKNNRCLEEMISTYLKRPSLKPSWQALINVLKSKDVDEGGLARKIEGDCGEPPEVGQPGDQEAASHPVDSTLGNYTGLLF